MTARTDTPALDWSPEAVLTNAHAEDLMARGACSRARRYVGKTASAAAKAEPWAALRFAADRLTDAQFVAAAEADPWAALEYAAADRLRALHAAQVGVAP